MCCVLGSIPDLLLPGSDTVGAVDLSGNLFTGMQRLDPLALFEAHARCAGSLPEALALNSNISNLCVDPSIKSEKHMV